jgi:hypothetical protein
MEARAKERNRLALRAGMSVKEEVAEVARMLEGIEARLGVRHGVANSRAREGSED